MLINHILENGWIVLNRSTEGDNEGEFTFHNRNGSSTLDLAICSSSCVDIIKDFKVLSSNLSCHSPIMMEVRTNDQFCTTTTPTTEYLEKFKWEKSKREDSEKKYKHRHQ
jgi:hypothetical protein